jgi:hypothetical protein
MRSAYGLAAREMTRERRQSRDDERDRHGALADAVHGHADGRQRRCVEARYLVEEEDRAGVSALRHVAHLHLSSWCGRALLWGWGHVAGIREHVTGGQARSSGGGLVTMSVR